MVCLEDNVSAYILTVSDYTRSLGNSMFFTVTRSPCFTYNNNNIYFKSNIQCT